MIPCKPQSTASRFANALRNAFHFVKSATGPRLPNSLLILEGEVKIAALVSVRLSTDRASHHHILEDFLITPSKVSILPIS